MVFHDDVSPAAAATAALSLAPAKREVFWLDDPDRPPPHRRLDAEIEADLCIVGGGFSGLWTAVLAKEQHPDWKVVLLESDRIASGATGRNGGFCSASLTHGLGNGISRWPEEMTTLLRLGHDNLECIEDFVGKHSINCEFTRSGELSIAVEEYQLKAISTLYLEGVDHDLPFELLTAEQTRERVNSPTYLGALFDSSSTALLNPARLAWGVARVAGELGVQIFEGTTVTDLTDAGDAVIVRVAGGRVRSRRMALATNAYPPLLRRLRRYIVPVYDYALMTQPLTPSQRAMINWSGREGISDCGNQFHYYRITEDGRILWGGYDAVYYRNNGSGPEYDVNEDCFTRLATNFLQTFPQLAGLEFSHAWGGAIDTCSRFSPFWGLTHGGKTAYVAGYTGLGVGSSRFGAEVMLDLLTGQETERTRLRMVCTMPKAFPPEPIRSLGIKWTVASLQSADRNSGRRNLWLRLLDRLGLGFDS